MDINMPVMDGFDASALILKKRAENPTIFPNHKTTIIALTSYTDMSTKSKCLEIGC